MNELLGQLLALLTFFAFPGLQYILLKRYSKREGRPELWYLPAHGFRLVVRNIPGRRTLSEIRLRALLRDVVPAGEGSSVATWNDHLLVEREDFFLFPGSDQVLLAFGLDRDAKGIVLVHTDKLGVEQSRHRVSERGVLIADYSANLENVLSFDVKLAKRAEFAAARLAEIYDSVVQHNVEQSFQPTRVRDVG